jgi:DNA (cytosine-5)-methyltransferase 1
VPVVEAMKRALDLFCCDGGAAMGLFDAGFDEIVGIDIDPHPNYPFDFIRADATRPPVDLSEFHFIWASPPCQGFSWSAGNARNNLGYVYPNLIEPTRDLLKKSGLPYCIENVMEAPIREDLMLCGLSFGLALYRHRKFEISGFRAERPKHFSHHNQRRIKKVITCAGHGSITEGGSAKIKDWQNAMGIHHTKNRKYLAEAVPPAYSKYIASEFFRTGDIK